MIEQKMIGSLTQLSVNEGYIHLKGTDTYCKSIIMLPSQTLDDYEEVAEIPPTPSPYYAKAVEDRIRSRYSLSEELAILRQRYSKPEEFAEYFAFAEQAKADARTETAEQI